MLHLTKLIFKFGVRYRVQNGAIYLQLKTDKFEASNRNFPFMIYCDNNKAVFELYKAHKKNENFFEYKALL